MFNTHIHIICIVHLGYTYVIICYYTYIEKDDGVAVIIHFRETTIHQLPTTHGEYISKKKTWISLLLNIAFECNSSLGICNGCVKYKIILRW